MGHSVRQHFRRDYYRRDGTYVSSCKVSQHWRDAPTVLPSVANGPWAEDDMGPTLQFTRDCAAAGDAWAIHALQARGEPSPPVIPRPLDPEQPALSDELFAAEAERSRQFTRDRAAAGDPWAIRALRARGEPEV